MVTATTRLLFLTTLPACLAGIQLGGPPRRASPAGQFLGLRNQGNTCYMNSLLQVLYHLPDFRRSIYSLPTRLDAEQGTTSRVVLELQRLFYRLQYAADAGASEVGTEGLTRSFGWGPREVLEQQDVQEFSRLLCETVQEYMREAGRPDDVAALFSGCTVNTIRCTNVDFSSAREERWYDLQMQVQRCAGLRASFGALARDERLVGANRYNTRKAELGRQDARRSARFRSLPPVLLLHLQRFEYDGESGEMRKLQQAFRFPTTNLRLDRYMASGRDGRDGGGGGGGGEAAPPPYALRAVLSHVGHFGSGHYVAYVRRGAQWWEFDDTRVSAVPQDVAVRRQYGGRHAAAGGPDSRFVGFDAAPNAYMLVYAQQPEGETDGDGDGDGGADASLLPPEVRAAFEGELRGKKRPPTSVTPPPATSE